MKFAEKIVWSCLLTIAIVYSLGSTIMVGQNHANLLNTMIQQNTSSHAMEIFSLESKLVQDTLSDITEYGANEKLLIHRAIYYIEQFAYSKDQNQASYGFSDSQDSLLYSSIDNGLRENFSIHKTQKYTLKQYQNKYYMLMTSQIKVGKYNYYLTSSYDMTSSFQERDRQLQSAFVIGAFILILSFFIIKILSRYLTDSIRELNRTSQSIASGHYSERTHIQSNDEIGELSQSFDDMADMNEKTIHELQQNVRQREEFMGSFSHEIKTPMTSILGYADMLRTFKCDEETTQKAAHYIFTEGQRLANLSYVMMDLLAIRDHQIELEPISMTSVMKQLDIYNQGQHKDNHIEYDYQEGLVLSNEDLLLTLLRNLIDNAIKASQLGQVVQVIGRLDQNKYHIQIIDKGIGMSQEDIEKAAEPFYMADKSRSRSQGGAGLGLSIVQRICDVHHTQLVITSQIGQGTTVSFELEVSQDE